MDKTELDLFIKCFNESTSISELGRKFFGWKTVHNTKQRDKVIELIESCGLDVTNLEKNKHNSLYVTYVCATCGKQFSILASIDKRRKRASEERFCSRECSNKSRSGIARSETTKDKIRESMRTFASENRPKNTFTCVVCGKVCEYGKGTPYRRKCRVCSKECKSKLNSIRMKQAVKENPGKWGGLREGSFKWKGGYYKGIRCDSTYELAYVVYCLDNSIPIKRCKESFVYLYEGKQHRYHPDFIINENEIVEIKGYVSDKRQREIIKLKAATCNAVVLHGLDMLYCFEWVKANYGLSYRVDKRGSIDSTSFVQLYDKAK